MKKIIVLTYLLLQFIAPVANAQVSSYTRQTDGVLFKLQNGVMKVYVCRDNIIRVNYCADTLLPSKTILTVNNVWETPFYTVSENDTSIVVSANSVYVNISKSAALLSFYSAAGSLILSEYSKQTIPIKIYGINTHNCYATFNSPSDEAIYGLGQHQDGIMNYRGKTQILDQANKEIALPVIISNKGYGLLWDNYSQTLFDGTVVAGTKYQFNSQGGDMVDYYFMYGPELDSVISAYRIATGAAPLFPKWAYGLFQSKNRYASSSDLLNVMSEYRQNGIPLDCIVQDWQYWNPYPWGSHIMNPSNYPDPAALIDSLHKANIHTMISIWAMFAQGIANYNEFSSINAILCQNSFSGNYYYDAHNPQARAIYWRQVKEDLFAKYGWDAWWADADEPEANSFDRDTATTALGKGCLYYNSYPLMHTSGVYAGWRNDIPGKRLFTLSRSAFTGQQRNASACWSGDIGCTWLDLRNQFSAGLNFCMSGIPYWTTDIGGYASSPSPNWALPENRELFIRWFEYGTFCPVYRIHGVDDKSLMSSYWDAATRQILRNYDRLRYRLMPYIYSLAWMVTSENYTIMRHLIMDYRTDSHVKNIDSQFMFGPYMMINPVYSEGATKKSVYLPAGDWYDFWTGSKISGGQTITADAPLDTMPIFIKAGSIIPMTGQAIQCAAQSIDPLEIRVYRGADAKFVLYEDEGDTYNYEKGQYSLIPFTYNEASKKLTIGARQGAYNKMLQNRTFDIVFVDNNHGGGLIVSSIYDTVVHYIGSEVITGVVNTNNGIPARFTLSQNFPNPFNPSAMINYQLPVNSHVTLKVYDVLGREVQTLINEDKPAGSYTIKFDVGSLPSGVYFYRLQAGSFTQTKKLVVVK